jgi:ATP-dependent Lon protease
VRNLERRIGAVCRKIGTNIAEGKKQSARVTPKVVKELLGHPVYMETEEIDTRTSIPGVVPGLAWTPFGGDILFIEATKMPGAKGFQITGSVGNVMQESARAALSYVRSHAEEIGLRKDFFDKTDIHMHIPAGAQPKDGPSAGVTMATAMVSLLSGRPVKKGVGMTGEITLRGQVLPVGGIKEKMIAAHRAGLKTIILPKRNGLDLEDLPAEVRKSLSFVFAETVNDVLEASLEKVRPARKNTGGKKNVENTPG